MMGTAVASGIDRARIAAEQAVASPLLDGIDLSGARGVLVNITASKGVKGKEIGEVMAAVRAFAAPDATIARGVVYNEEMGDSIRVTVVATGLGRSRKPMLVSTPVLRTGTNNEAVSGMNIPVVTDRITASATSQAAATTAPVSSGAYESLQKPAVWRRESASDTVRALEKNGMETYDIPAFLRRQAD